MTRLDDLVTFTDTPDLTDRSGRIIVTVPKHLGSLQEVYHFYGQVLGREGYFGTNSGAFVDCLTDPDRHAEHWQEIVVWHPSLPRLGKRAVGAYFINLLLAQQRLVHRGSTWPSDALRLHLVFRARARRQLVRWSGRGLKWLNIDD